MSIILYQYLYRMKINRFVLFFNSVMKEISKLRDELAECLIIGLVFERWTLDIDNGFDNRFPWNMHAKYVFLRMPNKLELLW